MSKEELICWFDDKLNNCYHVMKNNNVVWLYDKNYVRKKKLAEIEGKEIEEPVYDEDKILFYQNQYHDWFDCNYDKIWQFLENNYSLDYDDIQSFIKDS